jgi:tRNA uracil 4-sulfurtransferase
MYTHIVVHYDEIGLKKKNRGYFEDALKTNLQRKLNDFIDIKVNKQYGRIVCTLNNTKPSEEIIERLSFIPGIASFSFSLVSDLDINNISKKTIELLSNKEFNSFRIDSKRGNKSFKLTSMDVNKKIGAVVVEKFNKKVDLTTPEKTVFIEICEKDVFIYDQKHYGVSGLPIREKNSVVCSLSGGLDSPVSAYMLMKRGCQVIFAHVQNNTQTNKKLEEKIINLVKILTNIQLKSKLIIIPFSEIQTQITSYVPSDYRMIIYRRFMMKLLEKIVKKEKAFAIVTGDSVGQVASQTLENINAIYAATTTPIFSPLIGLNKEEIITISKKIGTYNTSIQPYPDCCSFMVADHPKTKAVLEEINTIENNIPNKEELLEKALANVREHIFKYKKE